MAPETYYYFFSLVLAFGIILHMINLIHLRIKGRALIGPNFKPGTPEYKRLRKFSRTRNLFITAVIAIFLIANLIFEVYRLMHMQNHNYAHFMLIFAPTTVIVASIGAMIYTYNAFGDGRRKT